MKITQYNNRTKIGTTIIATQFPNTIAVARLIFNSIIIKQYSLLVIRTILGDIKKTTLILSSSL